MTFTAWKALSAGERTVLMGKWEVHSAGYWHTLNGEVVEAFREEFGSHPAIRDVTGGPYHGGTLIVGVVTSRPWNRPLDLPEEYHGFPVRQFGTPGEA